MATLIDHLGGVALCRHKPWSGKRQIPESQHLVGRPSLAVAGRAVSSRRPGKAVLHYFSPINSLSFGSMASAQVA